MSLYLQTEDDDAQMFLASTKGWGDFCRWVATVPAERSKYLRELCDKGISQYSDEVRRQLRAAVDVIKPSPDVRSIAQVLTDAPVSELWMVTDGMGSGEDEPAAKAVPDVVPEPLSDPPAST